MVPLCCRSAALAPGGGYMVQLLTEETKEGLMKYVGMAIHNQEKHAVFGLKL